HEDMIDTPPPYELVVRGCTIHAGRYRWDILQSGTPVQSSMESFTTAQEAHKDGRQVIEKLMQIPRPHR
ncbi:MAG TPA: hypothetical protein VG291_20860, partial [Xanthobacteraceae bacterium]|nr:hypothetical protein [Xanthobacteraceae bacterium]